MTTTNYIPVTQQMREQINAAVTAIHSLTKAKGFWDLPDHIKTISRCLNDPKQHMSTELSDALRVLVEEPNRNDGEMLALMHSELSEALEGLRKKTVDGLPLMDDHVPELTSIAAEMADTVIRIFDYCGGRGIDLGRAIALKHQFNATRPPKHGKKF